MPKEIPKFGTHEIIQFVGVHDLDPDEQMLVNKIATENYEKIKRELHNVTNMVVHIKCYEKEGGKKKYSLHVRAIYPSRVIESCKSHDFDLARALHKSFDDIKEQIKHHFHSDRTRPDAE